MHSANERPGLGIRGVVGGQIQPCQPITPQALPESALRLATIDDWALALQVSRPTVERLIRSGQIPPADIRIGRLPRWRPATLRRYIEGGVA
jgi:excisionase family DNA binding protein